MGDRHSVPRSIIFCVLSLLLSASAASLCAATAADSFNPAGIVAQLSAGVKSLDIEGNPGVLTVYGERACTLLTNARGQSIAAAALVGKGKAVALTHDFWFRTKSEKVEADNRVFLENLLSWLGSGRTRLKILTNDPSTNRSYPFERVKVDFMIADTLPDDASSYPIILWYFPYNEKSDESQMLSGLSKYVADGGSVIGLGIGWVYTSYGDGTKGKSLAKDYSANKFFGRYGIAYNNDAIADTAIAISESQGNKSDVSSVIANVRKVVQSHQRLSESEINPLLSRLYGYRDTMPFDENLYDEFYAYYDHFGKRMEISETNPIDKTESDKLLTIATLDMLLSVAPPEKVARLRHVSAFPGDVSPSASPVTKECDVSLSTPRWQSTGLYAPAGVPIGVRLDPSYMNHIAVRIGAHTDLLSPLNDSNRKRLDRWPDISLSKTVDSADFKVASPHGGLVYLEVIGKPGEGHAPVIISGAVSAPYFVLGKTTNADWAASLRACGAPWGELAADHIVLTLPIATLRKVDDPETLMKFWEKVLGCYPDLIQEPPRSYPERIVADEQISDGYMHNGYPIMTGLDVCDLAVGKAESALLGWQPTPKLSIFDGGSWGHYHELGHNYQKSEWTFDGSVEVTVNLFTLYVLQKVHGMMPIEIPALQPSFQKLKSYIANGSRFDEWKQDPFLALTFYIFLQNEFGWQAYKSVFVAYQKLGESEKPKTDQEKMDTWLAVFSNAVQRNLGPYFKIYGIPVTQGALDKVTQYPAWMPGPLQAMKKR